MSTTFEIPGVAERRNAIAEALDALEQPGVGQKETYRLVFRGESRLLPVVNLELDQVLLNPSTHRLRAQMESDPRAEIIRLAPYSADSQRLIADMLRENPSRPGVTDTAFTDLLEDIKAKGQLDVGVVSRDGVLFNGNTRAVALRDLKLKYIRLAVLPPNASAEDFDVLELTLQVQKDLKRDYSFANELLMIEEQVEKYQKPIEDVARLLNRRAKTVKQLLWILQQIRVMQHLSEVTSNGQEVTLPLAFFNDHQGKLEELHRAYEALGKKDPVGAERMRLARLIGVVLSKSKTDLRFVQEEFYSVYLATRLASDVPRVDPDPVPRTIPGTNIVVSYQPDLQSLQATKVLTDAVRAAAVLESGDSATPTAIEADKKLLAELDKAFDAGLTAAGKQDRLLKRAIVPVDKMGDAAEAVEACYAALLRLTTDETPDWDDFDDRCDQLRKALYKVAKTLERRGLAEAHLPALRRLTSGLE